MDTHIDAVKPWRTIILFSILMVINGFGGSYLYASGGENAYAIGRLVFALVCFILFIFVRKGSSLLKEKHPIDTMPVLSAFFLVIFIGFYMGMVFSVPMEVSILFHRSVHEILLNTCIALTAGIFEETLFRGLLPEAFGRWYENSPHPLVFTALWSSLLFGLVHLSNYDGTNMHEVLIQVFYAVMLGLALFTVRILTNRMDLNILLHFLIDWQPDLLTGSVAAGPFLSYLVIFLPIGLFSIYVIMQLEKKLKEERL